MPRSDRAFTNAAERLAGEAESPRDLERSLRALYPQAVVRERGLANESRVLYIYRDGHYQPEHHDPWWEREPVATARIDVTNGVITDASAEFAALLGNGPDVLVGRSYASFLLPEAVSAAAALLDALRETGSVTSKMLLLRIDGSLVTLEFHAVLRGHTVEVVYRPVETS